MSTGMPYHRTPGERLARVDPADVVHGDRVVIREKGEWRLVGTVFANTVPYGSHRLEFYDTTIVTVKPTSKVTVIVSTTPLKG